MVKYVVFLSGEASMSKDERKFSHLYRFTGYMKIVRDHVRGKASSLRILDLPAGSGMLADALKEGGHTVICGDMNEERDDYVYVDMNERLPFDDNSFDMIVSLEGIEHTLEPVRFLKELIRICKKDGEIIISTPNILNLYGRLVFLLSGTFYKSSPANLPVVGKGEKYDRGHISPMSYHRLRYYSEYFGACVTMVEGDRYKSKILFPLYALIIMFGFFYTRRMFFNRENRKYKERNSEIFRHLFSPAVLFSRSIVVFLKKG
jgi:SAM-dependent methyltransferase